MSMNQIDFHGLWSRQNTSQPDLKDLTYRLRNFKQKSIRTIVVANVCLITTAVFIIWVWIHFQPEFLTTRIGIVLIIVAMSFLLLFYNQNALLYRKIDSNQSNRTYLDRLLQIREKQKLIQSKVMNLYYIALSVGIGLYMIEYTVRMIALWAIIAYAVTGAWLAFAWFYIRPKQVRNEQKKLNEIISHFEEVSNQLENP